MVLTIYAPRNLSMTARSTSTPDVKTSLFLGGWKSAKRLETSIQKGRDFNRRRWPTLCAPTPHLKAIKTRSSTLFSLQAFRHRWDDYGRVGNLLCIVAHGLASPHPDSRAWRVWGDTTDQTACWLPAPPDRGTLAGRKLSCSIISAVVPLGNQMRAHSRDFLQLLASVDWGVSISGVGTAQARLTAGECLERCDLY